MFRLAPIVSFEVVVRNLLSSDDRLNDVISERGIFLHEVRGLLPVKVTISDGLYDFQMIWA